MIWFCPDFSNLTQMVYHGRVIRATPDKENVRVRIHNIRSARPEPEIEILYAVYEDGEGASKPFIFVLQFKQCCRKRSHPCHRGCQSHQWQCKREWGRRNIGTSSKDTSWTWVQFISSFSRENFNWISSYKQYFFSLFEARGVKGGHQGFFCLDDRHISHLLVLSRPAYLDSHLHLQTEMGTMIHLSSQFFITLSGR